MSLTTAAQVRSFYAENPERLSALSEAAQRTVAPGARGRLHPDVRTDFNSDHRGAQAYAEGTKRTMTIDYKRTQPSGRRVKAQAHLTDAEVRAMAIRLGVEGVGSKGPLSKEAIAAVAEHLTAESAAAVSA